MKFLLLCVLVLIPNIIHADKVVIDVTGWTQEQKNWSEAIVFEVLAGNGCTFKKIMGTNNGIRITDLNNGEREFEIDAPSKSLDFLTKEAIEDIYSVKKAALDSANAAAIAEEAEKKEFINDSELKELGLNEVDEKINAISNLDDMKTFTKDLVKYLVASGAIR